MLIIVNDITIDTKDLRCGVSTREGYRCNATVGDKGMVEVETMDVSRDEHDPKFTATCGSHVNRQSGDRLRNTTLVNASHSGKLLDSVSAAAGVM